VRRATANPYHYGTPVVDEHFAGRDEELAALVSRLRNGINVVLLSPRRFGKTSLLLRAERSLADDGAATVHVNVLRCRDVATLAGQLATNAYRAQGARWHRARQAVPAFLQRIRATPSITFDGDQPKFTFQAGLAAADADGVIADVYALLDDLSGRRPAALVLDEFQAVVSLGPHLPALLKSLADEHPGVALVVAGSRKHVMEDLVSAPNAALYGMAERIELGPLPAKVMTSYLRRRARAGRKPMTAEVAGLVVDLASPVPNDIQRLAYEAYDVAGDVIDDAAVRRGLDRAVAHEAVTYAERFERLAPGQRRVVVALAENSETSPYSGAFAARTGLANASSVSKAISALEADELVIERDGALAVSDPFFAAWLRESP
jgi:uncharacterized protein